MSCRSRIKSGMTDPASRLRRSRNQKGFRVKPGMTNWPVLRIKDKIYNLNKAFDRRGTRGGEPLMVYGETEK
jgi:hypothetical protein